MYQYDIMGRMQLSEFLSCMMASDSDWRKKRTSCAATRYIRQGGEGALTHVYYHDGELGSGVSLRRPRRQDKIPVHIINETIACVDYITSPGEGDAYAAQMQRLSLYIILALGSSS